MKLSALLHTICEAPFEADIAGIACDSRRVEPGFLFVCIDGVEVDGHRFAQKAIENGATVIVAQRDLGLKNQILLPDTRSAWAKLSANWFDHPAKRMRLIGVTDTNGKTSSTYMLKHALEACGHKVGLIGTIQSMIGNRQIPACHTTPEAYELQGLFAQMAEAGCDDVVMEVSSHALAQCRVDGVTFDAAIFTNLTQDHLDYHKTMEAYCDAKRKLFLNSRLAVLNADDPWFSQMSAGITCPLITFSLKQSSADAVVTALVPRPDGAEFSFTQNGKTTPISMNVPGEFSVYNATGVLACLVGLGEDADAVGAAFKTLTGIKGRAEVVPTGRGFSLVIDYAHTPDGIEKICETLRADCKGRLITVFGAAGERDRGKRPQMGEIAARFSDLIVLTSDNPRREDPMQIINDVLPGIPKDTPCVVYENRFEAIRYAVNEAREGDTVLLAGKGHETYQVLNNGIIHLDEREVVAEALGMKNKWEFEK